MDYLYSSLFLHGKHEGTHHISSLLLMDIRSQIVEPLASLSTGNIQVRPVAVWCVRMSYLFFYRVFRSHAGYALNSMFIYIM